MIILGIFIFNNGCYMTVLQPLSEIFHIRLCKFPKKSLQFLEAEIFTLIHDELKKIFRKKLSDYFQIIKLPFEKENTMMDEMFVSTLLHDILATEEYDLKGISRYTNLHEDVIQEALDGRNTNPSIMLVRKCIDLHKTVKPELYDAIKKNLLHSIQRIIDKEEDT